MLPLSLCLSLYCSVSCPEVLSISSDRSIGGTSAKFRSGDLPSGQYTPNWGSLTEGDFAGFTQPVVPHDTESRQAVRKLVSGFYKNLLAEALSEDPGAKGKVCQSSNRSRAALLCKHRQMSMQSCCGGVCECCCLSWYLKADCCDKVLYSSSDDVPKWERHRFNTRHSFRFLSTRQHL